MTDNDYLSKIGNNVKGNHIDNVLVRQDDYSETKMHSRQSQIPQTSSGMNKKILESLHIPHENGMFSPPNRHGSQYNTHRLVKDLNSVFLNDKNYRNSQKESFKN